MQLPEFEYLAPQSGDELAALLADHGEKAKILAGGTDLLVMMKNKLMSPEYVIDVGGLKPLCGITEHDAKGVAIGAATKLEVVQNSSVIRERYYALYQAIRAIGSSQVRAMGSLGGNSCTASPAADSPPALIALGAKVTLASRRGRREMDLESFITGNGQTALEKDEYLERFLLPPTLPNSASRFSQLGKREAMECDVANVAVNLAVDPATGKVQHVGIAMGAVGPRPLRAIEAEKLLQGQEPQEALFEQVGQAAAAGTQAIDDFRGSGDYRREVIRVLTIRTLRETLSAIKQS
jgi:carbon-monoxide dehydrogenase medium subunit